MGRLRTWFALPARDAGPEERLRWVRRTEIACGVIALVVTATVWQNAWWNWLMIGTALLCLSPWPGAAAILRKARTRPEVLNHDLARGRRRARRTMKILVPTYALIFTVVGYAIDGWAAAAVFFAIAVVGGVGGVWLYLKLEPSLVGQEGDTGRDPPAPEQGGDATQQPHGR